MPRKWRERHRPEVQYLTAPQTYKIAPTNTDGSPSSDVTGIGTTAAPFATGNGVVAAIMKGNASMDRVDLSGWPVDFEYKTAPAGTSPNVYDEAFFLLGSLRGQIYPLYLHGSDLNYATGAVIRPSGNKGAAISLVDGNLRIESLAVDGKGTDPARTMPQDCIAVGQKGWLTYGWIWFCNVESTLNACNHMSIANHANVTMARDCHVGGGAQCHWDISSYGSLYVDTNGEPAKFKVVWFWNPSHFVDSFIHVDNADVNAQETYFRDGSTYGGAYAAPTLVTGTRWIMSPGARINNHAGAPIDGNAYWPGSANGLILGN